MSPAEQRDRFSLTSDEVTHLRRAILGLESPPPAPQHRWDLPGQTRTESSIPDVVGWSLSEATEMLRADKFVVGEVTYQDSELPSNTVLVQDPCANSVALTQTKIDLTLATGLTVRIPDVVCKTLSQALVMLRDAGLKSEPELCFVSNEEYPSGQVIAVSPGMRSYITPNSNVTLQVANCSNDCIENTSS